MATVLQILKGLIVGILLGCLAVLVLAGILFAEHAYIVHHRYGETVSFEDFKLDFLATLFVGVRLVIPALVACTLLIPWLTRRSGTGSALLIGLVIAGIFGFFYANFYRAPFDEVWKNALHYGAYLSLWALWYAFHTRKRLMREGPLG